MDVMQILRDLSEQTHLDLELKEMKSLDNHIDLLIEINKEQVYVEEKYEVRPNQIPQILKLAQEYHNEIFLLASNYITPNAKELLNLNRINYIDAGGNVMLKLKNGLIHVEGKHVQPPSEDYKNRAFTKVGAKLIFTFLKKPEDVNLNYRALSTSSTCSLGSISKIIDHLKEDRFIITLPGEKLKLVQQDKLMNKWIDTLSNQLLPALLIGNYRFANNKNWYEIDLRKFVGYQWGGEVAAAKLTQNLQPQEFSIYTSKNSSEFIRELQLISDRKGKLKIYKTFWKEGPEGFHTDTVDPILIYGELMASEDSRNMEVATEVKLKHFSQNDL